MKNIIRINKASFYAYHGVFQSEQNIGGKFEADVEIYTDFASAAKTDSLKRTVDYETVYRYLKELAMKQKFYLIETLCMKIIEEIFTSFAHIERVVVRVRKNNPPIGGVVDSVEVEIEYNIDEWEKIKENITF